MTDLSGGNLTEDVLARLDEPDSPALARRTPDGWQDVSISEFHAQVTAVAKGLLSSGISPGDRMALLSSTRYEWTVIDYAIWWIGAITVPVYDNTESDQVAHILTDSGASAAIVETDAHAELVAGGITTWVIEQGAVAALSAAGAAVDDSALEQRRSAITSESVATIVYTSGTTTTPKGCVLTHGNFRAAVGAAIERLPDLFGTPDASTLLFLPLAHVFARIIQVGAIRAGVRLGHSGDVRSLPDDLATFHPTFVLGVPRVFEKVLNNASTTAYADGRGAMFDAAVRTAIAYSRAMDSGKPGMVLRGRHKAFDKLVYSRIREALGGQAMWAVSGGAPLGERLAHFFRGSGVPILEGYGLTETTAAILANTPQEMRIGTVGKAMPGVQLRLASDAELEVRGPHVFGGYWNDPHATSQVLDGDGWFTTGDLAEIDDDGFVRIVGRKKEILVTAGGKAVAPGVLEDRVRAHPVVAQCLVVGDGKPFVGALVTIDREAWAESIDSDELRATVQSAIDAANRQVSQAESIRAFAIIDAEWTRESGYVTPSFKLKRFAILRDFHDQVEGLFVR